MRHINLRIADELHAQLKAAADAEHRSLNAQITLYLERAVHAESEKVTP